MICLCDFRETMTVVGIALPGYMGYRMDDGNGTRKGRHDMRIAAGLGACSACDYCLEHEETILLVEDTRLTQYVNNLENKYSCLRHDPHKKLSWRLVRDKMRAKVCGSMSILFHLATICHDAKVLLEKNVYKLWVIVPDDVAADELVALDGHIDDLKNELKGDLRVVTDCVLIPISAFKERITPLP